MRSSAAGSSADSAPEPERPGDDVEAAFGVVRAPLAQRRRGRRSRRRGRAAGVRPSWMSTLARPRSPSNSSTRRPCRASACASVMANQVLPTPPLPEATAMSRGPLPWAGARRGVRACHAERSGRVGRRSRRAASNAAVSGIRPSAAPGPMPASVSARPPAGGRKHAAEPARESSRVATSSVAPAAAIGGGEVGRFRRVAARPAAPAPSPRPSVAASAASSSRCAGRMGRSPACRSAPARRCCRRGEARARVTGWLGDDEVDAEQPGEGGELLGRAGAPAIGGDHHAAPCPAMTRRVASRATVSVLPAPGGPASSSGAAPGQRQRREATAARASAAARVAACSAACSAAGTPWNSSAARRAGSAAIGGGGGVRLRLQRGGDLHPVGDAAGGEDQRVGAQFGAHARHRLGHARRGRASAAWRHRSGWFISSPPCWMRARG